LSPDPEERHEINRRHSARVAAWHDRRNLQNDWFRRTGLTAIARDRRRWQEEKDRIERELMELMIGPDKAATDA
jgi:hypothetical protein